MSLRPGQAVSWYLTVCACGPLAELAGVAQGLVLLAVRAPSWPAGPPPVGLRLRGELVTGGGIYKTLASSRRQAGRRGPPPGLLAPPWRAGGWGGIVIGRAWSQHVKIGEVARTTERPGWPAGE